MVQRRPIRRLWRRKTPATLADRRARADRVRITGIRITEAGAAFAAFLLSLSIFMLGAFQWLRGAEIVLLPPQYVFLYRDAPTPENAVLGLAVEAGMINTARADYGDVAIQAYAEMSGTSPAEARFPYDAAVEPVNLPALADRADACPAEARCILAAGSAPSPPGSMGLMVIDRRPELLSVPGGSSRSDWLGFTFGNCLGQPAACERFYTFDSALDQLRAAPELSFRITLDFYDDGRKTFACALENQTAESRRVFLDFLEERGWATLRCRRDLRS